MKWFKAKSQRNESIGVEFTAEGVAFAYIQRSAREQPRLVHCEFLPVDASLHAEDALCTRLAKLGLTNVVCNFVVSAGNYQLLLGEAPKVPPEELAEALRWRIKDLITYPISDAVLDAFLLPEDSARGATRMAYAVVSQRSTIVQILAQVKAAQLVLNAIDIPELVLRNLANSCCDTKRGIALVKLGRGGGSLQIIRDGELYLSRQFSLAYNAGLLDELPAESLALELQRSLDYFERQMRQSPPAHIYIFGENVTSDKLTADIRNNLAVQIDMLNLESGLQLGSDVQPHTLSLCYHAIGAALREDAVEGL